MVRTVYPIPDVARGLIKGLAEAVKSTDYDLVVRVDVTKHWKAHRIPSFQDFVSTLQQPFEETPLSPISLSTLLDEYPLVKKYLYDASGNVANTTGHCCDRPDMWQLATPNDIHFILHSSYDYVWVIEDDFGMVGPHDDYKTLLMQTIMDLDRQAGDAPFVAVPFGRIESPFQCPAPFVKNRHTIEFEQILSLETWRCVSDSFRRFSRPAALTLDSALKKGMFSHVETFIQPILLSQRVDIYWWDPPMFHQKLTDTGVLDCARKENVSFALFQRTLSDSSSKYYYSACAHSRQGWSSFS